MPSIEVTINERKFRMACEEGQEAHLRALAESFDQRIASVKEDLGEIGDARLTVVAALMLADELHEASRRIRDLEAALVNTRDHNNAIAARGQAQQAAMVAALNAAAERIEKVTRDLNQVPVETVPVG